MIFNMSHTTKGITPDEVDAVGDGDEGQANAAIEGMVFDDGDAVGDGDRD